MQYMFTTRPPFVDCPRHSIKGILHSTKDFSSVALRKERSVKTLAVNVSLSSTICWILGKDFGKKVIVTAVAMVTTAFSECLGPDTQQRW